MTTAREEFQVTLTVYLQNHMFYLTVQATKHLIFLIRTLNESFLWFNFKLACHMHISSEMIKGIFSFSL